MATSPNYSWPEPDNTDLVKNGALAIRTMGNAIDTTMATMTPKSTVTAKGDIVVATAASTPSRLPVGTNGQVLKANSATATGLEWGTDSAGMTNPMTTTGDTIYSSSGSTPARLGIGTAGQVLQVNSGATAPEWATPASGGGMTLLSTTTLSGTSTTISSISGSYKHLLVVAKGLTTGTNADSVAIRFNGDTGSNYSSIAIRQIGNTVSGTNDLSVTSIQMYDRLQSSSTISKLGSGEIWIYRYTDTDYVNVFSRSYGNTGTDPYCDTRTARYDNTAAITSMTFFAGSTIGGTIYIYGVN